MPRSLSSFGSRSSSTAASWLRHPQHPVLRLRVAEPEAGQARLPLAQQVAAAAQAEILVRDREAVLRVAQQGHAAPAGLGQPVLVQQQAVALRRPAADPAAQLVQLRQAEAVGVLHHHHAGAGHVDTHLDHRRRYQQAGAPGAEGSQGCVPHPAFLLAVGQPDPVAEPGAQVANRASAAARSLTRLSVTMGHTQ